MKAIMLTVLMLLSCNAFAADMAKNKISAVPDTLHAEAGLPQSATNYEILKKIFEEKAVLPNPDDLKDSYAGRGFTSTNPNTPLGTLLVCKLIMPPDNGPLLPQAPKTNISVNILTSPRFDIYDGIGHHHLIIESLKINRIKIVSDGSMYHGKNQHKSLGIKKFYQKGKCHLVVHYQTDNTDSYHYLFEKKESN